MIITIDGPAGTGKSSVARALAERLGFRILNTGAMYRAVALAAMEAKIDLQDEEALEQLAQQIDIRLTGDRVLLSGRDVSAAIRSEGVTTNTRHAADNVGVRARLVDLQRAAAQDGDVVTEGRDQGTVAFPDAECKIYLTASEIVRAERRCTDLLNHGETPLIDQILADQRRRDQQDASRKVGALKKAADAIEVDTDGMTLDEVVDRLEEIVRSQSN